MSSMIRFALDSNILIYAEGGNDAHRRELAHQIIGAVVPNQILVPIQTASETMNWLIKKAKLDADVAALKVNWWLEKFPTQSTSVEVFEGATELCIAHQFQFFDSIILAAAWVGDAQILLSEDMQDGFKWRGVTVVNPFLEKPLKPVRDILGHH
jgi:predicted nucleic acid-binding protein